MLRRTTFAAILCFLLIRPVNSQTTYAPTSRTVESINETVFHYVFSTELRGSDAEAFCISSVSALPRTFTERFSKTEPPVVSLIACPFGGSDTKKTPPVKIQILKIDWKDAAEVYVRVFPGDGGIGASQQSLRIVYRDGRWNVIGVKNELFS